MPCLASAPRNSDVEIGTVLAFTLGLGVLFISLYTGYATEAYSILFGEILGISSINVIITFAVSLVILVEPRLYTGRSCSPRSMRRSQRQRGCERSLLGIIFMVLLAAAVSIAVQVVGVLLIFALMVTPAATAIRLTKKPSHAYNLSVLIALFATWLGLFISFYEPYPVSFFITSIVFILYLFVRFVYPKFSARPIDSTQVA